MEQSMEQRAVPWGHNVLQAKATKPFGKKMISTVFMPIYSPMRFGGTNLPSVLRDPGFWFFFLLIQLFLTTMSLTIVTSFLSWFSNSPLRDAMDRDDLNHASGYAAFGTLSVDIGVVFGWLLMLGVIGGLWLMLDGVSQVRLLARRSKCRPGQVLTAAVGMSLASVIWLPIGVLIFGVFMFAVMVLADPVDHAIFATPFITAFATALMQQWSTSRIRRGLMASGRASRK
ncbi:MAG: hypothetical protein AAGA25_06180 [Planctomycetota bacterium]